MSTISCFYNAMLVILCNATLQCNMLFCAILSAICCVKSFSMLFVFLLLALACTNNVSNTKPKNNVHKLTIKYSISCRIVSYRIVSYRIVSYRIVSHRIVLYCTLSYRILQCYRKWAELPTTNQPTDTNFSVERLFLNCRKTLFHFIFSCHL